MQIGPRAENHVDRISGGTLQLGDHLVAAWSRVQRRIALSSGEAELCAGMRGISETLGFRSSDAWVQVKRLGSYCSSCVPVHVAPSC